MNDLKNYQTGLKNFARRCENVKNESLDNLLTLHGNLAVLIDKSMSKYSNEIAYAAQDLQKNIRAELQNRIKRNRA